MSRIAIGPAVLMVPDHAGREVEVADFAGTKHQAQETPAAVAGPYGMLFELAYRRWQSEGQVVMLSRGDSSPAFDRLLHGVRLGVKGLEDGTEFCEVDLLRWEGGAGWGNVSMVVPNELDLELGDSTETLMVEAGALAFGTRAEVLNDTSRRRNRLCATFPAEEPMGPLTVYVLTRILPILKASAA